MRKKCPVFALIFLLILLFYTPASAATEYGVIYDETDALGSQTLKMQGEQTLPQLTETLGIDLRVDVLTQIDYDRIGDAAMGIYKEYNYGYGEKKEGVTLTVLMEPQDGDTYAMPADGWCVYVSLRQGRGSSRDMAVAIRDAVEPYMAERVWNGADINMSAVALTQAVDAMAEAAEDYVLTNCPPDSANTPAPEAPADTGTDAGTQVPDSAGAQPAGGSNLSAEGMQHVFDSSGLLDDQQRQELESRAAALSQSHDCGIYFALVDDYTDYADGSVYEVTYQIYHNMKLGMGEGRDGLIVLLSMAERDYAMFVYGDYAQYAFNEFGQEQLEERFLGYFGEDDWYRGISRYLDACDEFLTKAEDGDPVRPAYWKWHILAGIIGCLAAGSICSKYLSPMKTVHQKAEANVYLTHGGLKLTKREDQFVRMSETRQKIDKGGSGGGTHSESGGGGSGRSGKF